MTDINQDSRDLFMNIWRNSETLNDELTPDDRAEIFVSILLGSSDVKKPLLDEMIGNFNAGDQVAVVELTENTYGHYHYLLEKDGIAKQQFVIKYPRAIKTGEHTTADSHFKLSEISAVDYVILRKYISEIDIESLRAITGPANVICFDSTQRPIDN